MKNVEAECWLVLLAGDASIHMHTLPWATVSASALIPLRMLGLWSLPTAHRQGAWPKEAGWDLTTQPLLSITEWILKWGYHPWRGLPFHTLFPEPCHHAVKHREL